MRLKSIASVLVGFLPVLQALVITTPCCSEYQHRVSAFGPALPVRGVSSSRTVIPEIEETIVLSSTDLCAATAADLNNTIVVVPRGGCTFGDKVLNSQAAGALAVVVYETDTSSSSLVTMSADPVVSASVEIPSVFVSSATGVALVGLLGNATGAEVAVLNGTGSVFHGVVYYDVTLYTVVMLLGAVAALLLVVVIVITGCCQRVERRGKNPTSLSPGEYEAEDLLGGRAQSLKEKGEGSHVPPRESVNPRYKGNAVEATV